MGPPLMKFAIRSVGEDNKAIPVNRTCVVFGNDEQTNSVVRLLRKSHWNAYHVDNEVLSGRVELIPSHRGQRDITLTFSSLSKTELNEQKEKERNEKERERERETDETRNITASEQEISDENILACLPDDTVKAVVVMVRDLSLLSRICRLIKRAVPTVRIIVRTEDRDSNRLVAERRKEDAKEVHIGDVLLPADTFVIYPSASVSQLMASAVISAKDHILPTIEELEDNRGEWFPAGNFETARQTSTNSNVEVEMGTLDEEERSGQYDTAPRRRRHSRVPSDTSLLAYNRGVRSDSFDEVEEGEEERRNFARGQRSSRHTLDSDDEHL